MTTTEAARVFFRAQHSTHVVAYYRLKIKANDYSLTDRARGDYYAYASRTVEA